MVFHILVKLGVQDVAKMSQEKEEEEEEQQEDRPTERPNLYILTPDQPRTRPHINHDYNYHNYYFMITFIIIILLMYYNIYVI